MLGSTTLIGSNSDLSISGSCLAKSNHILDAGWTQSYSSTAPITSLGQNSDCNSNSIDDDVIRNSDNSISDSDPSLRLRQCNSFISDSESDYSIDTSQESDPTVRLRNVKKRAAGMQLQQSNQQSHHKTETYTNPRCSKFQQIQKCRSHVGRFNMSTHSSIFINTIQSCSQNALRISKTRLSYHQHRSKPSAINFSSFSSTSWLLNVLKLFLKLLLLISLSDFDSTIFNKFFRNNDDNLLFEQQILGDQSQFQSHQTPTTTNSNIIFVNAFDIVTVQHRKQVVSTDITDKCPCTLVEMPCYDANAGEGSASCAMPMLTAQEVADKIANGETGVQRCGTFLDCIELQRITENQQQALVAKQILERSRLSQFKYENAPVLDSYGIETTQKNVVEYSRWTYVGCFAAQVTDVAADATVSGDNGATAYNPNDCINTCTGEGAGMGLKRTDYYENQRNVIIGISGLSCACVVDDMTVFIESPGCDIPCLPGFSNPLCGGQGDAGTNLWGLYMEYEYMSYGSQGAYDVWRYMWYTIVAIRDSTIRTAASIASNVGIRPERYFLHCTNEQGRAVFQNQIRIEEVLLYGLEYDITGSRLVALAVPGHVGRVPVISQLSDETWVYKLTSVEIDESDPMYPKLTQTQFELNDENLQSMSTLYKQSVAAQENFVFTGASTIVSRVEFRSYGITQIERGNRRADRFFLFSLIETPNDGVNKVSLSQVKLIHQQNLDFKCLQLFSDTRSGTISAVGPINGAMSFAVLGYLFKDSANVPRWHQYYDEASKGSGRYFAQEMILNFHIYPGGGTSGPSNNSFVSYRNYDPDIAGDRPRLDTSFSVIQINQYSGSYEKWCQIRACEEGEVHRSIDPEVPYANLFNAEAGYPLTLSAPKVEHARFTIEGLFLRIVFDVETTRGAIPVDTDGNKIPDRMDQTKDRSSGAKFDCAEVLTPETLELIGTYPETSCTWKDDATLGETLEIEFGSASILSLGDQIEILSDRVFAKPLCQTPGDWVSCEWSPAAVSAGAIVSSPDPLLPPIVIVDPTDGTFSIDECSDIELKADESKRTGGTATYVWTLDDSDGEAYTSLNTVSSVMNMTKYNLLLTTLASTTGGKLLICVECMPQGYRYKMKVAVTSRWGLTSELSFVVEKADYPAPTIRTGSWSSPTIRTASQGIRVETEIRQSSCAVGDQQLACSWSCISKNPDWTKETPPPSEECRSDETFDPAKLTFPVSGNTLVIPRYTLAPPTYTVEEANAGVQKFFQYTFQILCIVVQDATSVTNAAAAATVAAAQNAAEEVIIRVERSPLKVYLFPAGNQFPQKATTMALNARFSLDPDLEETYFCMLDPGSLQCDNLPAFDGSFTFKCWKVIPVETGVNPATETEDGTSTITSDNGLSTTSTAAPETDAADVASAQQRTGTGTVIEPCFTLGLGPGADFTLLYQTLNGDIDGWKLKDFTSGNTCTRRGGEDVPKLDIGYNVEIEQVSFSQGDPSATPPVLPEVYCYYSEGLLLVETNKMSLTNGEERYTFEVVANHIDGREGSATADIYIVDREVLQLFLKEIKIDEDLAQLPLTSVYQDVVLEGTIKKNPNFDGASYSYRWEIFKKQSGGNAFVTEWKNETDSFSWNDAAIIEWDPFTTSRIIFHVDPSSYETPHSTQLQRSTSYKIYLYVTAVIPSGQYAGVYYGLAQRIIHTAPGPPIRGSFTVKPETYTFPDDLLTDPPLTFNFDAPQWRADSSLATASGSSGNSMSADLDYSFGFIPTEQDGSRASIVWQVQKQASTHFEITARSVPYDGQSELLVMAQVCTVYKVCATSELTLQMIFREGATLDEIQLALLPPDAEWTTSLLVAAMAVTNGIKSRIPQSLYDELQDEFRRIMEGISWTGMSDSDYGAGLQALNQVASNNAAQAQAAAGAGAGDQTGKTLASTDGVLNMVNGAVSNFNGDVSNAAALMDVFSGVLASTQDANTGIRLRRRLGQYQLGGSYGNSMSMTMDFKDRLRLVRLLSDYEEEYGEDLLETVEKSIDNVGRSGGLDGSNLNDAVGSADERKLSAIDEDENFNIIQQNSQGLSGSDPITALVMKKYQQKHSSEFGLTEVSDSADGSDVNQQLDPDYVAHVFKGKSVPDGRSSEPEPEGITLENSKLGKQHHIKRSLQASNGNSESGHLSGNTPISISDQYGRRFSRTELDKRLRIFKELQSLGYAIPMRLTDGHSITPNIHKILREPVPSTQQQLLSAPSFLVSTEQTRALEFRERKLGEFGSPLVTHRPRRPFGQNHEQPPPRRLYVGIKHHLYASLGTEAKDQLDFQTQLNERYPCSFCGVYHTPFPKKDSRARYVPYNQYSEVDMRYLYEDESNKNAPPSAYTLTWNRTASCYQITDVRRKKIVTQSFGGGPNQRKLETKKNNHNGPSSIFGYTSDNTRSLSSDSDSEFHVTLNSEESSLNQFQDSNNRNLNYMQAPLLLRKPEAITWTAPYIQIRALGSIIHDCPSSFCDQEGLYCLGPSERARQHRAFYLEKMKWQCCNLKNPNTLCNKPPCWFPQRCPKPIAEQQRELEQQRKLNMEELKRELQQTRDKRSTSSSIKDMFAGALGSTSTAEKLRKREARHRKLEESILNMEAVNNGMELVESSVGNGFNGLTFNTKQDYQLLKQENWFKRWMRHEVQRNTTVGAMYRRLNFTEANAPFSFADRARAFELYHEDPHRQLAMATNLRLELSLSAQQKIAQLEGLEKELLVTSRRAWLQKQIQSQNQRLADARLEIEYTSYDPATANAMRSDAAAALNQLRTTHMDARRNVSQALTRLSIYRDRIVSILIPTLVTNARNPLKFDTSSFIMRIGKVTNMSAVSTAFIFPSEFIVPADSPDEPTLTNPTTALAYQYIEYKQNIYSWSPSTPASQDSFVITLLMFKANGEQKPVCVDLPGCNTGNEFIRVFADFTVYSSGVCLIWDRFYPDTAGGAWSGRDIVNDGDGCLTLSLGDIGFFIDGRPSYIRSLTEAGSFPLATLISKTKLSTLATLIMVLLFNWFLIFWGYKCDEKVRSDQRAGIIPYQSYHFDGDGLSTPLNADDPIAYRFSEVRNALFLKTFWNVLKREHLIISPLYYHETFTRPQRGLCVMALITGLLAINAAVYGNPNKIASGEQFVISGILSGLVMYPIYCMIVFMFTGRPQPAKRRMIKKRQMAKELDMINQEKQKLIAQSSLLPPGMQMGGGFGGPGGMLPVGNYLQQQNENISLLALPPPIAMGPGGMPGMVGMVGPGGGGGSMLALPGPPGFAKPPAPKYPPPPGYAKALPAPQEMLPPIYFSRAGMPQLPALPSFAPQPKATTPRMAIGAPPNMSMSRPPGAPGTPPQQQNRSSKPPAPPPAIMGPGAMNGSSPGQGPSSSRLPTPPGMGPPISMSSSSKGQKGGGGPPGGPMPAGIPKAPSSGFDTTMNMPAPPPPPAFAGQHNSDIPMGDSARTNEIESQFQDNVDADGNPIVGINLSGQNTNIIAGPGVRIFDSPGNDSVGTINTARENTDSARTDNNMLLLLDESDTVTEAIKVDNQDHNSARSGASSRNPQEVIPNMESFNSSRTDESNLSDYGDDTASDLGLSSPYYAAAVSRNTTTVVKAKGPAPGFEGNHRMMPPPPPGMGYSSSVGGGAPPPPPPPPRPPMGGLNMSNMSQSGPFNSSSNGRSPSHTQQYGFAEPKTPTGAPPFSGAMGSYMPSTPKGMPPVIPFGAQRPDTLVARGQPPPFHVAPFKMPPPPGAPRMPGPGFGATMGPDSGMQLALVGSVGGGGGPGQGPPMPSGPIAPGVPLPPPPPREDDSAFVRRVRLIYMDRVMKEHAKQDLLELEGVGRPIPNWVFNISAVMPYVTCASLTMAGMSIVLVYALKFDSWQELHWYYSCDIGFAVIVFLLDIVRAAVLTIVELRKYEIRKRSKAGDFVVRKVQKKDDSETLPALLKPKPKVKAKATSAIPKVAPKFASMERPRFLPDATGPGGPPPMPALKGGTPRGGTPQGARTPLGAKTPPRALPFGGPSPMGSMGQKGAGDISPTGSQTSKGGGGKRGGGTPPGGMSMSMSGSKGGPPGMGIPPPPPFQSQIQNQGPGGGKSQGGTPRGSSNTFSKGGPVGSNKGTPRGPGKGPK